jgi:WD40 repeat protein
MYQQGSQTVIICDVSDGQVTGAIGSLQCSLQSHQRAVSNLNWSPFHWQNILTCSADQNICLWDARAPQFPVKFDSHSMYPHTIATT